MTKGCIPLETLIAAVGEKQAMKLCKLFSGQRIPNVHHVLLRRRDQAVIAEYVAGAQIGELSAKYGMSRKHVTRIVNKYITETVELPEAPRPTIRKL